MSDTVIKVENLSKYYKLGVINNGTLVRDIQTALAHKRGIDDPNAKIDAVYDSNEEGFWALRDLNFEVHQGDRVGIIGHNGAGKSTLLKILSQVTAPTKGVIKIKGRISSLLEVGTGFHGELTGRENIYMNGAILGMKRREIDRKIDEIIDFSEIEKHIDTPVKRYSSGMYVRLAFAVAAHLDSEILIADEVLAVGDAAFQKKALGKMNDISTKQGRTVLFVSHQIPAVASLCNTGMFLKQGVILEQGNLQNCIALYLNSAEETNQGIWEGEEGDKSKFLLTKVALSSASNPLEYRTGFKKGEKALLSFDYEILSSAKENFVFNIEIFNYKGYQLCALSAADAFARDEFEGFITKGKHTLCVEIDTALFASGQYKISFDFAIHNVVRFIEENPIFNFTVENMGMDFTQSSAVREGVISPKWKWTGR